MELAGRVVTGTGKAQKFLSLEPYKEKIEQKTGINPFPGTLNINTDEEKIRELKKKKNNIRIEGFQYEGEDYGGLDLYKVEIEGLEAALLDIDRAEHREETAEIIAEEKLRKKLDLEDGDRVKLNG